MKLDELVEGGKKRHAALTGMWKPISRFLGSVSAALTVYRFFKNSGEFTLSLLGLLALTLFLLYYATSVSGVKLLVRRALALFIDLSLIGVALFASMSWYQANIEQPQDILQIQNGQVLMLALWLAFLYFVFFDWRFKGTLGKRFVGLTVTTEEKSKISLCRSFIRAFLSFPLPIISAVFLNQWIVGGGDSAVRILIGDALKNALLSFVPLSILFFEGNQSIADRLTRLVVRAEHEAINLLPKIRLKTWILLCSSNLAWAFLFASLYYLALFKPLGNGPSKPLPRGAQAEWLVTDPQAAAALWTILPMGLKEPMYGIKRIDLVEASPNPFTFQAEESHFLTRLNPEPYVKTLKEMPIVRVTLTRERPLQVKLVVVQNFATYVGQKTPMKRRPAFSVLQIATEKKFGLFSIDQRENILLCWMGSGNNAVDFYTDVRPHGSIQFPVSIDEIGFLLAGAGIPYRY